MHVLKNVSQTVHTIQDKKRRIDMYINLHLYDIWRTVSVEVVVLSSVKISDQWLVGEHCRYWSTSSSKYQGLHWSWNNEQTFSLQLSDLVYSWACWVCQAVCRTWARMLLLTGSFPEPKQKIYQLSSWWWQGCSRQQSLCPNSDNWTRGQLSTQDRLHRIWCRAGYSPSPIITRHFVLVERLNNLHAFGCQRRGLKIPIERGYLL